MINYNDIKVNYKLLAQFLKLVTLITFLKLYNMIKEATNELYFPEKKILNKM